MASVTPHTKLCVCSVSLLYLLQRRVICDTSDFGKNPSVSRGIKKKPKISIIRRNFPANQKDTFTALESKDAASIMKKLNWENTQLFGPVQFSKTDPYNSKKIYASNQIIQHETQIPIIEPDIEQTLCSGNKYTCDLSVVLGFPLQNKLNCHKSKFEHRISELNHLRKYLEFLHTRSSVPSVSHILEKTMPKERVEILERWKQSMINQLGEDGFQRYHSELLASGSSLHTTINNYLTLTPPEAEVHIEPANTGHWKSLKAVFPCIRDVKVLEEKITHPFLQYRGIIDCFAKYKDHLVVIDWKTSKKTKPTLSSTYDNPLQIAAYVGALNFDQKFQYLANKGLIVVAYENGQAATTHFIDENTMLKYWNMWLKRVKLFWEMSQNKHS